MNCAQEEPIDWRDEPEPGRADAIVGGALGWLFMMAGAAAVAAAALIPTYFETLDIQQSREVEAAKAGLLSEECQRYVDFHQALIDEDQVLLERLALTELRLKAVGTEVAYYDASDPMALVTDTSPDSIHRALVDQPLMRSIENELSRPDLKRQADLDIQVERPRRTRLVEAATGEFRPVMAGAGGLLLMMGLWPRRAVG